MRVYHPKGRELPALERNILKYRALEMMIILFEVENLKNFVLSAVQGTDKFHDAGKQRIPEGAKNKYRKAWAALVSDRIITQSESAEIQRLIDYRNSIGHRLHELTYDLSRETIAKDIKQFEKPRYDYEARKKIKDYRDKIHERIGQKYIVTISFDNILFEAAEKTYEQELRRLGRKIIRQLAVRKQDNKNLNRELVSGRPILSNWHPPYKKKNGTLTIRGVEICYQLFDEGKSTLAVAHLLRISYRATVRRRRAWEKTVTKAAPSTD
jgi:hypothetical protein